MRKHLALISFYLVCGLTQTTTTNAQGQPEYWERGSAMAIVESVDIDNAAYELGNISSLADADTTLARLRNVEIRVDWPLPAREAAIYEFTRSLAGLPREAVAPDVMQHLRTYQARVLVPHEDHGDAFVPLFNIRGAAAGVENAWQRTEFAYEAETLLKTDPAALVSAYVESAGSNQRSAYLDVLKQTRMTEIEVIQEIALRRLGETPELTPLLGVTAEITADTFTVQQLLVHGQGAGLSSTLVQLGQQLPLSETADLLDFAIRQAPVANASLAISAWWPRLKHEAASRDLLVELLADPALGASAALALAQSPDILTIKVLQDTADDDSSAAKRAQMALDFSRNQLIGEVQP
ncbi:MAG: hypothetical protein GY732_08390 [Gammaproteobacteria bacterium]|nr:hypothetical protein [Gammaproteobacteria bacterium]